MANDLLNPPETETAATPGSPEGRRPSANLPQETGHELDAFLCKAFEEKSAFASLFESIHDVFFPTKLPPLVLESKPIPVIDRMATKQDPRATAASVARLP